MVIKFCYKCKLATIKVLLEMLHSKHQSQCLLLILSIVALTSTSVLDAKAIGYSDPSGKMCVITASRPYAEASAANFNGNIES